MGLFQPVSALPPGESIFSIGDAAVTLDLGNRIDEGLNDKALKIRDYLLANPIPGILDVIVAYSSVSIFYDPELVTRGAREADISAHSIIYRLLYEASLHLNGNGLGHQAGREGLVKIPVCYEEEFAPDLAQLAEISQKSPDEIVQLHTGTVYRVYMIGFLPGFGYMGKVQDSISIGRKQRPVPVTAGSVGIAGSQTGIYPLNSPGGWQIIGRTPLTMFDPQRDPPVRLSVGDRVQFFSISRETFHGWPAG